MALQGSGPISLLDIQGEFGGSNPIGLNEYYRGGAYTTTNNTGVPTSGLIQLDDFYNAQNQYYLTIASNTTNADLNAIATADGWNGTSQLVVTINSGVWLYATSTSSYGLTINVPNCIVTNNGNIVGKGGKGGDYNATNGAAGGTAINVTQSGVALTNASGAYIAGGGGGGAASYAYDVNWGYNSNGGGGGAGGGNGGTGLNQASGFATAGVGATTPNTKGTDGAGDNSGTPYGPGRGGEAGGSAGGNEYDGGPFRLGHSGGGGGGMILPGVYQYGGGSNNGDYPARGGFGGAGGQAGGPAGWGTPSGFNTNYGNNAGAGGGGWGAAGGNSAHGTGGAAGAAISGTALSLTNNGTVYGAT
jgi:hypothetical protein